MSRTTLALFTALVMLGCGSPRRNGGGIRRPDASTNPTDASTQRPDATPGRDATVGEDAGPRPDASETEDSGSPDSGPPQCPVLGPETSLSSCSDACDNDQNGFFDCNDFSCCPFRSDCPTGTTCGDTPPVCGALLPENTLARCSNNCDDDPESGGPTFADCSDRACCLIRAFAGQPCAAGTYCADQFVPRTQLCSFDDVTQEPGREATLAACTNACDDDRSGFDDCSDRACCAIRFAGNQPCLTGTYCADMWVPGETVLCPGDDVTQPPGIELDLNACSDGCDNDRNGYQDCEDRHCCPFRGDCPLGTFCNP